jgi:hypothetical protein
VQLECIIRTPHQACLPITPPATKGFLRGQQAHTATRPCGKPPRLPRPLAMPLARVRKVQISFIIVIIITHLSHRHRQPIPFQCPDHHHPSCDHQNLKETIQRLFSYSFPPPSLSSSCWFSLCNILSVVCHLTLPLFASPLPPSRPLPPVNNGHSCTTLLTGWRQQHLCCALKIPFSAGLCRWTKGLLLDIFCWVGCVLYVCFSLLAAHSTHSALSTARQEDSVPFFLLYLLPFLSNLRTRCLAYGLSGPAKMILLSFLKCNAVA